MRRIVRRSLTVRYCERERIEREREEDTREGRIGWRGISEEGAKSPEWNEWNGVGRVMYRPPLANGRVKLCLVSTGTLHPDSQILVSSMYQRRLLVSPGIYISFLSLFLPFLYLFLSSTPLYFPPPDSKLFELASRDPNRPPSLPPSVRVNARFSYAQNEKTTARLNNDCRLQNRASSLIIFLPACVNCGLRNVQSRGNKYARGVERMLD